MTDVAANLFGDLILQIYQDYNHQCLSGNQSFFSVSHPIYHWAYIEIRMNILFDSARLLFIQHAN